MLLANWSFTMTSFVVWISTFVSGSHQNINPCLSKIKKVMASNSPELSLVPNEGEHNKISSNKFQINVSWSHIDLLLPDKSCIMAYLLEYGPLSNQVHERETFSLGSFVLPTLSPDITSYNIDLEDSCNIFYIQIVVMPSDTISKFVFSKQKRFWPAAYKTEIMTSFDSALVTWPDRCLYSTKNLQFVACLQSQPFDCSTMTLDGQSPFHFTGLQPCKTYSFHLQSLEFDSAEENLWSFPVVKTLPKFDVDILRQQNALTVKIVQLSGCENTTFIQHFRVIHCKIGSASPEVIDNIHNSYGGSGGGSYFEDEGNLDDYFDDNGQMQSKQNCIDKLYKLNMDTSELTITGLNKCTKYKLDISPVNERGQAYKAVEDFDSVFSTLCKKSEENFDEVWFSEDDHLKSGANQHEAPNLFQYAFQSLLFVFTTSVLFVAIILTIKQLRGASGPSRQLRFLPHDEDVSPRKSLIVYSQ